MAGWVRALANKTEIKNLITRGGDMFSLATFLLALGITVAMASGYLILLAGVVLSILSMPLVAYLAFCEFMNENAVQSAPLMLEKRGRTYLMVLDKERGDESDTYVVASEDESPERLKNVV